MNPTEEARRPAPTNETGAVLDALEDHVDEPIHEDDKVLAPCPTTW